MVSETYVPPMMAVDELEVVGRLTRDERVARRNAGLAQANRRSLGTAARPGGESDMDEELDMGEEEEEGRFLPGPSVARDVWWGLEDRKKGPRRSRRRRRERRMCVEEERKERLREHYKDVLRRRVQAKGGDLGQLEDLLGRLALGKEEEERSKEVERQRRRDEWREAGELGAAARPDEDGWEMMGGRWTVGRRPRASLPVRLVRRRRMGVWSWEWPWSQSRRDRAWWGSTRQEVSGRIFTIN